MQIHIEGRDLPGSSCHAGPDAPDGHTGIRVGVQRRGDALQILDPVAGDSASARWVLDCVVKETAEGYDFTGPYVQGRPHERFIYLSWLSDQGQGPLGMFRRGKIRLDSIPTDLLTQALPDGSLVVEVRLRDEKGNPACATFGPAAAAWRVA